MKKILFVYIIAFSFCILSAGEFRVSSKLDSVNKDGYYKIHLRPEIIAAAKTDYSDIRLLNSKGDEVPFIFREEQPATSTTGFKEYAEVPVKEFAQKDSSDKRSYITISFGGEYELNKLELKISGPEFYQRRAIIGVYSVYNNKSNFEYYSEYNISSAKPSIWETDKLKVRELVLVIENMDNKPLKVENVKIFQLNKYLIAKLEKGESYAILAGNKDLYAPDYDLKYFSDSIPDTIPTLQTGEISTKAIEKPAGTREIFTKTVLWVVIFLVISLLSFLSVRVIKEMSRR